MAETIFLATGGWVAFGGVEELIGAGVPADGIVSVTAGGDGFESLTEGDLFGTGERVDLEGNGFDATDAAVEFGQDAFIAEETPGTAVPAPHAPTGALETWFAQPLKVSASVHSLVNLPRDDNLSPSNRSDQAQAMVYPRKADGEVTLALARWTTNLGEIGKIPSILSDRKNWSRVPAQRASQPVLYFAPSVASEFYRNPGRLASTYELELWGKGNDFLTRLWGPLTEMNGEVVYESPDLLAALQAVSNLAHCQPRQEYGTAYNPKNPGRPYRVYSGYEGSMFFSKDDIGLTHTHGVLHAVPSQEDLMYLAGKYRFGLVDFHVISSHLPGKGNEFCDIRIVNPMTIEMTFWAEYFHPEKIRRTSTAGHILLVAKSYELQVTSLLEDNFTVTAWIERDPVTGNYVRNIYSPSDVHKELDELRGPYRTEQNGAGSGIKFSPRQIAKQGNLHLITEQSPIEITGGVSRPPFDPLSHKSPIYRRPLMISWKGP